MPTVDKSTPITWTVGDARLTRIAELEVHWPFSVLLPGAEDVIDDYDWLRPDFVTDDGRMRLSMHAVVIESDGLRIIVDTCVGNDKSRPGAPPFEQLSTPFMEDLEAAGFAPETIDYVVCTHLHVDHVGWNTRLVDGQWVPTFPNARYLFVQAEYDYWRAEPQDYGPVFEDSVQPITDAGLADLVSPDHRINDEVWFESTPGHTPGHVSVIISSAGERGGHHRRHDPPPAAVRPPRHGFQRRLLGRRHLYGHPSRSVPALVRRSARHRHPLRRPHRRPHRRDRPAKQLDLHSVASRVAMDLTDSYQSAVPGPLLARFEWREVRNAAAIAEATNREEWNDIMTVLDEFELTIEELMLPGGNKSD